MRFASGTGVHHDQAMNRRGVGDPLIDRGRPQLAAERTLEPSFDIAAVYAEHRTRLIRLATGVTLNREVGEELVQDAFAALQRHAATVDDPLAYLHRTVVNLGIQRIRRRATAARHPQNPVPPTHNPEIDETWDMVIALPPRQRAVVLMRYWLDLSERQIAEQLDWPPGTVKSTLHRALLRLKKDLLP